MRQAKWDLRWDEDRAAAAVASGYWANRTVADHCAEWLVNKPDHVAVIDGDLTFTFRQLHAQARQLASGLIAYGLKPGETIAFQLPNWHEAVVLNLAAAMAGLILAPMTPIYRDREIGFMIADSRARMMFIPELFRGYDYPAMMRRLDLDIAVAVVRGNAAGFIAFSELLATDGDVPLAGSDPNDVKMIMYTSGTTGRAKGVLHTHNSLQAENRMRQVPLGLTDRDILYNPSTVTHVTGALYSLCLPFTLGCATILADIWDPAAAVAAMRRHRATGMMASTVFLEALTAEAKRQAEHLPDLRFYLCGGAQMRAETLTAASEQFTNCAFARVYGSTEVPNITTGITDRARLAECSETDGSIWECEAKVVDPQSGVPLSTGSEGEIAARGPQMFLGYTREEDNDGAFTVDGFFRTGDLGRIVDGFVTVTGRSKDLIIRAGENISPKEVEDILLRHPAIDDIAIVAMPSVRTGEMACAFIIPRDGASIDVAEIARFLIAAGLAKQKIPERIEIVHELPRTAIGKVRKDVLRTIARDFASSPTS